MPEETSLEFISKKFENVLYFVLVLTIIIFTFLGIQRWISVIIVSLLTMFYIRELNKSFTAKSEEIAKKLEGDKKIKRRRKRRKKKQAIEETGEKHPIEGLRSKIMKRNMVTNFYLLTLAFIFILFAPFLHLFYEFVLLLPGFYFVLKNKDVDQL